MQSEVWESLLQQGGVLNNHPIMTRNELFPTKTDLQKKHYPTKRGDFCSSK